MRVSSARGVVASVTASVLFGAMFLVAGVVSISPEAAYGWRVALAFVCYGLALLHPAARRALAILWRRLRTRWWLPMLSMFLAGIVGVQLWLFMWAPANGHALDASLGYMLLPISLVLAGRFLLKQSVSRCQWVVVGLASVAVVVKITATPALSWVTLVICIPYAMYFVLRQRFGLDGPMAFGWEIAVMSPVAGTLLVVGTGSPAAVELSVLVAIGIASTAAMTLYLSASAMLTMPVFGLLGYVEPVLLIVVALFLGEQMHGADVLVYGILAVALTLLAVEGFRAARRPGGAADVADPA